MYLLFFTSPQVSKVQSGIRRWRDIRLYLRKRIQSGCDVSAATRRFIIAAAAMTLFFALTFAAESSETRTGVLVEVTGPELITGDLIVACKTLEMNGEVTDDLLAGGMNLAIGNLVGSDLTLGGYNLKVQGPVGDDARLAGANIEIDGDIDGDLVAFGGNVNILGDVAGDVITGGGNVRVSGYIQGSLDARCGDMIIDGTIGQSVTLTVSKLTLSPTAVLEGDLTYTSKRSADIAQGAQIMGQIRREPRYPNTMVLWKLVSVIADHLPERPDRWKQWKAQFPAWFRTLLGLSSFVSLLIAGIIILSVYGRHATMVADRIVSFPLKSFGLGLIFLICVPIGALILCITVIGLPIGLVALATYLVFFYISRVYVALAIGREILDRISKQDIRMIWPMALGLFIITALSSIPYYIGWVIRLVCILFGLGGMLMTGRKVRVVPREETV
jgi:cytoskeletal protein CcmA (bactofilin family)